MTGPEEAASGPLTVTSADGTTIAYARIGHGPPVVVVGGAFNDRHSVAAWAAPLAGTHTVLMPDRRGRGDSGDTPPYAVEREVEDLAAVIEAAGGSAALVGHSSGGALALEAAAAGLPVERVAAYEPPYEVAPADVDLATTEPGGPDGPAELPRTGLAAELARLAAQGPPGAAATRFLAQLGMPPQALEHIRQSPHWAGMTAIEHTLAYDLTVVGEDGVPAERFGRIGVPVLVLVGGDGWDWIRAAGAAVADAVPQGRLAEVPGQGHDVAPDALAGALLPFLDG